MTRRNSVSEPKTEVTIVPVAEEVVGLAPTAYSGGEKKKAMPRPCGKPEVPKTDKVGVKGEGGEFIKRGGKLIRS